MKFCRLSPRRAEDSARFAAAMSICPRPVLRRATLVNRGRYLLPGRGRLFIGCAHSRRRFGRDLAERDRDIPVSTQRRVPFGRGDLFSLHKGIPVAAIGAAAEPFRGGITAGLALEYRWNPGHVSTPTPGWIV